MAKLSTSSINIHIHIIQYIDHMIEEGTNLSDWKRLAMSNYEKQLSKIIKYSKQEQQWALCPSEDANGTSGKNITKITVMTINVLTDSLWEAPLKRNILFSHERYEFILQKIGEDNADIITFNEVTQNFYRLVLSREWVQQSYYVSLFTHSQQQGSFNLFITRIRPLFIRNISVQTLPRLVITGYFSVGKKLITVSATHLTSIQKNINTRKKQLQGLDAKITEVKGIAGIQFVHLIQGDLNLHQQVQNISFEQLSYEDCWTQKHSLAQNPGFTFDAQQNSLIQQVYWGFEKRRMRLDRILLKGSAKVIKIIKVLDHKIYPDFPADQPMNWLKGSVSLVSDIVGVNLFRRKQKYLFPSDHFGLLCELDIQTS